MGLVEEVAEAVRRSVEGVAWHGPSLLEAVQGVTGEEAEWRVAEGHSVCELLHHAVSWMEEALDRIEGKAAGEPVSGDWPAGDWGAGLTRLESVRRRLNGVMGTLSAERLAEPIGNPAPDGRRFSVAGMLLGVAQHNAYHAGQIVMIRRSRAQQ